MIVRVLYTIHGFHNVLHYDATQKVLESYGNEEKLVEYDRTSSRTRWKHSEHAGNYCIVQDSGSVDPHSYPCHHTRPCDLWCRRQRNVMMSNTSSPQVKEVNASLKTKFGHIQLMRRMSHTISSLYHPPRKNLERCAQDSLPTSCCDNV